MTKSDFVIWIGALIIYQAYATVLVVKSEHFDDRTKLSQVVCIWLLPLIGALLVRIALRGAEKAPGPVDKTSGVQQQNAGGTPQDNAGPDARS